MNIDKIIEIYGKDVILDLKDEDKINDIEENINYLNSLDLECVLDIVERYFILLTYSPCEFRLLFDKLIVRLGSDYKEILLEDISYLEELL